MSDKKPAGRGVVDSIYALRLRRFNEYGPGSARAKASTPAPTVDQLRAKVAAIAPKPKRPKKAKKRISKRARS